MVAAVPDHAAVFCPPLERRDGDPEMIGERLTKSLHRRAAGIREDTTAWSEDIRGKRRDLPLINPHVAAGPDVIERKIVGQPMAEQGQVPVCMAVRAAAPPAQSSHGCGGNQTVAVHERHV